jgi:hypothetical protein
VQQEHLKRVGEEEMIDQEYAYKICTEKSQRHIHICIDCVTQNDMTANAVERRDFDLPKNFPEENRKNAPKPSVNITGLRIEIRTWNLPIMIRWVEERDITALGRG